MFYQSAAQDEGAQRRTQRQGHAWDEHKIPHPSPQKIRAILRNNKRAHTFQQGQGEGKEGRESEVQRRESLLSGFSGCAFKGFPLGGGGALP